MRATERRLVAVLAASEADLKKELAEHKDVLGGVGARVANHRALARRVQRRPVHRADMAPVLAARVAQLARSLPPAAPHEASFRELRRAVACSVCLVRPRLGLLVCSACQPCLHAWCACATLSALGVRYCVYFGILLQSLFRPDLT